MYYNAGLLRRLQNKHLSEYKTSMEEIEKQEAAETGKKKKNIEPWYLRYPFESAQQEEKWVDWAMGEVAKAYPQWDKKKLEMEFNIIHMLVAPSSSYLFKVVPEGRLF